MVKPSLPLKPYIALFSILCLMLASGSVVRSESPSTTLANQAAFQLANLNFDIARLAPQELRETAYIKAIDTYHNLRSKADIIANQKQRLDEIRQKISGAAGNKSKVTTLTRQLQREQQKLTSVEQNPELATDAMLQIAACYMQISKYDEARIMLRNAQKFAREDQQKQTGMQIIITYALQGKSESAEKNYSELKQKFPNDPVTLSVTYFLGIALSQQGRYDEALARFNDFLKNAPPNSPYVIRVAPEKAKILLIQNKPDDAIKAYDDLLNDAKSGKIKLSPDEIETSKRLRATALLQAKKTPEALAALQDLAQNAKNNSLREDAAFQIPSILYGSNEFDKAAAAFTSFAKSFPKSPNADKASLYAAICLKNQKKFTEAIETCNALIKSSTDNELKPKAYEQIWRIHQQNRDYENMVKAQDAQIGAFPGSERNLVILYERAKYLEETAQKPDEAVRVYEMVVDACKTLTEEVKKTEAGRKNVIYASYSLLRCSDIYRKQAVKLGNPLILKDSQLDAWKKAINESFNYTDRALKDYAMQIYGSGQPGQPNPLVAVLQRMSDLQLLRLKGKLTSTDESTTGFSKLAGSLGDEGAIALVMIARASFVYQTGATDQALLFYKDVFEKTSDPKKINWQDYDRFGSLLLENKNWDESLKIFQLLKDNFTTVQLAQAAATYGLGAAHAGKGDIAQAESAFKELAEKYKWSEKILNADFNRGLAQRDKGNYPEAFKIWKDVLASQRSNSDEVKSRTMVEFGKTLKMMADKDPNVSTPETTVNGKQIPIYELAANYCLKAYFFYTNQANVVPEGLYTTIDIYMNKIQKFQDNAKNPKAEARVLFDKMSESYPISPWTSKAQKLL